MNSYKFNTGNYKIEIFAPSKGDAEIAWKYLQDRNYYPTGGKYYTETNSINSPVIRKSFQKITTDPKIDTLLKLNNRYRKLAIEHIIGCADQSVGEVRVNDRKEKDY